MRTHRLPRTALLIALVASASIASRALPALAQSFPTTEPAAADAAIPPARPPARISMVDGNFLAQALAAAQAERDLALLADQRANASGVHQFARQLSQQQAALVQQLKPLIEQQGLQLPGDPSARAQDLAGRLQGLSGPAFDRAYMAAEIARHHDTIGLYNQQATQAGGNPAVRDFARQTLPMLRAESNQAQQLRASLP